MKFAIQVPCMAVGCFLLATDAQPLESNPHVVDLDSLIHDAFDHTLENILASFADGKLKSCQDSSQQGNDGSCHVALPSEPDAAHEMLPFLMESEETMKKWRGHFLYHVKEEGGGMKQLGATQSQFPKELVHTLSTRVFWDSRPAASEGALNYWKFKADMLRKQGIPVTWKAHISENFAGRSIREAKKMMGTFLKVHMEEKIPDLKLNEALELPEATFSVQETLPEEFDSREAFPYCKDVIGHVRDQGSCGSCWAMASTESFNDRACIASKGAMKDLLSVQHTTSCCNQLHCLSFGCHGGLPRMAWRWFVRNGVVSGGDYGDKSGKTCWPYEIPNCLHHSDGPYPQCGEISPTPWCISKCLDQSFSNNIHDFSHDIHKADTAYGVSGIENIKSSIALHGTLTAAFMVFEDFVMYKEGVYHHVSGSQLGGHAVKLIGWGHREGKLNWLAVNSWNEYWGDKGTFRIAVGECGFEKEIVGGDVSSKLPAGVTEL